MINEAAIRAVLNGAREECSDAAEAIELARTKLIISHAPGDQTIDAKLAILTNIATEGSEQ